MKKLPQFPIDKVEEYPYIRFYPASSLVSFYKKGQITLRLLKELVKEDYLRKKRIIK